MAGFAVGQIAKRRRFLNSWPTVHLLIQKRIFLTCLWSFEKDYTKSKAKLGTLWNEKCSNLSSDVRVINTPSRQFFSLPGQHIKSKKRQEYSTRKLLGFSMENLYHVVSHVEDYKHFVPWCRDSTVYVEKSGHKKCKLEIGFPPFVERYISVLTLVQPNLVVSECTQGELFNYMKTAWRFSPGLKDNPKTTLVDLQVAFEFRSTLHSQLSSMFFDEVVKKMIGAFEKRCEYKYGPSSLTGSRLQRNRTRTRMNNALGVRPK